MILLHRPRGNQAACRSAANSIEKLLLLLEGTFGFTRVTYLIACCIYTGASAMIRGVKMATPTQTHAWRPSSKHSTSEFNPVKFSKRASISSTLA